MILHLIHMKTTVHRQRVASSTGESYFCTRRRCASAGRPWTFPRGRTCIPADPPGPGRSPTSSSRTRGAPERNTCPQDTGLRLKNELKRPSNHCHHSILLGAAEMRRGADGWHCRLCSPHILPLSMEPGLHDRNAFLLSRDLGSATIICDDTWKLDSGCLASVRFRRLVSCSSVRRSLFWLATSTESFLECGKGMFAGNVAKTGRAWASCSQTTYFTIVTTSIRAPQSSFQMLMSTVSLSVLANALWETALHLIFTMNSFN